jgi:predicted flap endonuclease-1-like 5' DNA nuclease
VAARERLDKYEQILAYIMGGGITIAVVGLILGGTGVIDSGKTVGTLVLIGLVFLIGGVIGWLYRKKPWEHFDDLTTPRYTGHDAHAPIAPAEETAADVNFGEAVPGAARSATPVEPPAAPEAAAEAPVLPTVSEAKPPAVIEDKPKAIVDTEKKPRRQKKEEAPAIAMPSPIVSPEPIELPAPTESAVAESAPVEAEPVAAVETPIIPNDLTLIEGIGPKVAAALADAGITRFDQVAAMSAENLESIVRERKVRLVGKTSTWPIQAQFLQTGELSAFEDFKRRVRQGVLHDDLTPIEGIGPKIQAVLYAAGIHTFQALADATPDDLKLVLANAGIKKVNPATWPEQAALVVKQDLTGLKALQDQLRGGHRKQSE